MSTLDNRLHAEADRRSAPADPEPGLEEAIAWLRADGRVADEQIEGLVIDAEVYDVGGYVRAAQASALRGVAERHAHEVVGFDGRRHRVVEVATLTAAAAQIESGEPA
ncbi:hypothetical protein [Isoptericola dokdonensis]|uniref:Uncharacterized protein n=1 Tax=Isoptericola dokdonensis DS-3 TaxID=1300344 RepID=A0A168FDS4_9MICO|nr:hypothetical protein [Isoptericola dokdonensis]ANC31469.1 hypothetical protein I598_1921 [Isoptericola dokdonensis DS-3]